MKIRLVKQELCSKSLSPPYWYESSSIDIDVSEEDKERIKAFVNAPVQNDATKLMLVEDPA